MTKTTVASRCYRFARTKVWSKIKSKASSLGMDIISNGVVLHSVKALREYEGGCGGVAVLQCLRNNGKRQIKTKTMMLKVVVS